jgi:hypothetical protein
MTKRTIAALAYNRRVGSVSLDQGSQITQIQPITPSHRDPTSTGTDLHFFLVKARLRRSPLYRTGLNRGCFHKNKVEIQAR